VKEGRADQKIRVRGSCGVNVVEHGNGKLPSTPTLFYLLLYSKAECAFLVSMYCSGLDYYKLICSHNTIASRIRSDASDQTWSAEEGKGRKLFRFHAILFCWRSR